MENPTNTRNLYRHTESLSATKNQPFLALFVHTDRNVNTTCGHICVLSTKRILLSLIKFNISIHLTLDLSFIFPIFEIVMIHWRNDKKYSTNIISRKLFILLILGYIRYPDFHLRHLLHIRHYPSSDLVTMKSTTEMK